MYGGLGGGSGGIPGGPGSGGGAAQNLGQSGSGGSQGTSQSENTSHGESQNTAQNQSTSSGTSTGSSTGHSQSTSSSDAKQTMSLEDAKNFLGGPLTREANAANPYTRQQFQEEANRQNSRIDAGTNAQINQIKARAQQNGLDVNSPAVQAQIQAAQRAGAAAGLENNSKLDAQFRQMAGQFDQANAGQNITQRGQDYGQQSTTAGITNSLLGQTVSGSNSVSDQNSQNQSQQTAQSTGNSQGTSLNDAYGYSTAQNSSFSNNLPVIGFGGYW